MQIPVCIYIHIIFIYYLLGLQVKSIKPCPVVCLSSHLSVCPFLFVCLCSSVYLSVCPDKRANINYNKSQTHQILCEYSHNYYADEVYFKFTSRCHAQRLVKPIFQVINSICKRRIKDTKLSLYHIVR